MYISHCCGGKLQDLSVLFESYLEDQYTDAVDYEGSNGVLLAACEEHSLKTIKWLESRGVALDQKNHYGRTALMEAALWGRLETVNYLVAKGANINAADANCQRAIDLAKNSERIERTLAEVAVEGADANKRRRQIAALLALKENASETRRSTTAPEILVRTSFIRHWCMNRSMIN